MEKIESFHLQELSVAGFKSFEDPQTFAFGDLTMITGANHVGKSSIADAIAFCVTGTNFLGESRLDDLYCEANPDIEVRMCFVDQTGMSHELVRKRKKDRMNISYDGYNVRQLDINELFGERDVFLSIFNPLYFIEELREEGKELLEKHLPFIPQETVLSGISEYSRNLLMGKDILAPENYMKELREEIRGCRENIIAFEGQSALLISQRKESAQALNLLKVQLDTLTQEITALETKKAEGNGPSVKAEFDGATDTYNELLNSKPVPPDTSELERSLCALELELERVRANRFESKFVQQIADIKADLSAAYAEHQKVTSLMAGIQVGRKCPVCLTDITEAHLGAMKKMLAPQAAEIVTRGKGLRIQLADLTALEQTSKETFEKFQQDDLQSLQTEIFNYRKGIEISRTVEADERADYEAKLLAVQTRMQEARDALEFGNLTMEESAQLSKLLEQRQQTQADFAAQEMLYKQQADNTKDKIAAEEKEIKQKESLLHAAADYTAKRAELTFEKLTAGDVQIKLYEVMKTTGEVKDCFKFTYKGRSYRRLSRSERILAGVCTAELVKQLTGRNYPMFIDDSESISNIPRPSGQTLLARVVPKSPLKVAFEQAASAKQAA